jgi:hypothetical protein
MTKQKAVLALALTLSTLLAGCAKSASAPSDSGITGIALVGPTCPVERVGTPCPDEPMAAVDIVVKRGGETVATVTTGEDGRFRVELEPGGYLLEPVSPSQTGFPFGRPMNVTVKANAFTDVQVLFDSGLR